MRVIQILYVLIKDLGTIGGRVSEPLGHNHSGILLCSPGKGERHCVSSSRGTLKRTKTHHTEQVALGGTDNRMVCGLVGRGNDNFIDAQILDQVDILTYFVRSLKE